MRNLELKARDADPARSLKAALALGADDRGVIRQRVTYFSRARGRLKLREQEPGGAELIAYERADAADARPSDAAYPQGQCGEASELGALVAAGEREVTVAAVVAERGDLSPPCGGCRQPLVEPARSQTPVHLGRPGGPRRTGSIGELLPMAFVLDGEAR
jgi:hypothetical protein